MVKVLKMAKPYVSSYPGIANFLDPFTGSKNTKA